MKYLRAKRTPPNPSTPDLLTGAVKTGNVLFSRKYFTSPVRPRRREHPSIMTAVLSWAADICFTSITTSAGASFSGIVESSGLERHRRYHGIHQDLWECNIHEERLNRGSRGRTVRDFKLLTHLMRTLSIFAPVVEGSDKIEKCSAALL
jgi:hypothetical protein